MTVQHLGSRDVNVRICFQSEHVPYAVPILRAVPARRQQAFVLCPSSSQAALAARHGAAAFDLDQWIIGQWITRHCELLLRRGNPEAARTVHAASGLPRRFAPRNDEGI